MAFKKKKGQAGEAKRYISRNRAARMLQISLPDFRRLCIYKGIYPREPKSRKKAQKGDMSIRTLYLKRDIIFLAHEPIIWKLRDEKVYRRKVRTLLSTKEKKEAKFYKLYKRPHYKLDHMVLERYPTFQQALQDLDDPLSSCFLYATFAKVDGIRLDFVQLSRKLTTEFLNYVIESRTLRKAFITIRGYYYRAHIQGEKITWMIPHVFQPEIPKFVDIRIMRHFIEFYCTLLGFVNFKLYTSLNLRYPPKVPFEVRGEKKVTTVEEEITYLVETLNTPMQKTFDDSQAVDDDDEYDLELLSLKNDSNLKLAQKEQEKVKRQVKLFENVKFFLGRETNRESLTLVIRSTGGLVSWDSTLGPGATYTEDDKEIAYQIVDRPDVEKKYLTRYYIQPQWVYDSFNNGILLPVQDYFVGADLPAHLSPFEETYSETYTPPEMQRLKALMKEIELLGDKKADEMDVETSEDDDDEEYNLGAEETAAGPEKTKIGIANVKETTLGDKVAVESEAKDTSKGNSAEDILSKMKVRRGKPFKRNLAHEKLVQDKEDYRMASSFIHRKQKRLFKRVVSKEMRAQRLSDNLKRKRILYEQEMVKRRKLVKKLAHKKEEEQQKLQAQKI